MAGAPSAETLNFHHLRYFWAVVKAEGVSAAARRLHVSQPALSAQLRQLEDTLGERLFARHGRRLVLTEVGRTAFHYADEIFGLGQEMLETLRGQSPRAPRLSVGIANVMPKLIAYRLLRPALELPTPVRLECLEDRPEQLLAQLAVHRLDAVLSDAPAPAGVAVAAHGHLLGECGVSIVAAAPLARTHRRRFPRSLQGAPMLLPSENTSLRRALQHWFRRLGLQPRVVGEFEDSALLKAFGEAAAGLFPIPSAIEEEVRRQYGAQLVGRIPEVRERFYVLTVERRLRHPAVVAISERAHDVLSARP